MHDIIMNASEAVVGKRRKLSCKCLVDMQQTSLANFIFKFFFQISELYDVVIKTEPVTQLLPQTIERLIALESLHRQGKSVHV